VIASKCVYEFRRDQQRVALLEDFDDPSLSAELDDLLARIHLSADNLEDEIILRERMLALDQVLRILKPEAREIYVRWLMGERPRTLAVIYGKKVGTIAQLLQRTSKKIEAYLHATSDVSGRDNSDE
jgi:DNA-directed RNA polymerase specialized sigma24 family protein